MAIGSFFVEMIVSIRMHYQRPCRQRAKGSFHIMAQTNYRCHLGSCRKTTLLWYVIKIRYSGLWEKRYILSIILIQNLARSRWFCRFQWDNLLGMCKILRIYNWDAYWIKCILYVANNYQKTLFWKTQHVCILFNSCNTSFERSYSLCKETYDSVM